MNHKKEFLVGRDQTKMRQGFIPGSTGHRGCRTPWKTKSSSVKLIKGATSYGRDFDDMISYTVAAARTEACAELMPTKPVSYVMVDMGHQQMERSSYSSHLRCWRTRLPEHCKWVGDDVTSPLPLPCHLAPFILRNILKNAADAPGASENHAHSQNI